ncbi:MAG: cation:proton antiporter, partial [Turneriella sp.]|nr:cation:proton antiporter [Turneriella sp.]
MPENVLLSVATLLAIALAGVLSVVLARWLRIHPAWFFIFIGSLLPYFWPQAFATKNLVGQLAEIGALFLVFLAALDIPWELRLTLRPREAARLLLQYFASMLPLFVFFYFLVLPGEMAAAFGATLLAGAFVPPSRQHSVEAGFRSYPQQEKPALRGVLSESTVLVALGFLLPLSQRTFTGAEVLRQMVALLILLVAMLYLIPQVLRLILRRTGEESYALFYSTIALIFITIAAGYFLGLEPMLGAYAVGFIISRFVAQGSRILGRLRFIGLSFFVPAFYMEFGSTGMLWQGLAWQMVLPVLLLTAAVIAVRSFQRYAFGWENTETAKTLLRIQRNPMVLALLYFAFVHGLLPPVSYTHLRAHET